MEGAVSGGYPEIILEHFRRPLNRRKLERPTVVAEGANPLCGDRIRIELVIDGRQIREAAFSGDACAICIASSSLMTEMATSVGLADLMAYVPEQLLETFEGRVPASRRRCAALPIDTMQQALLPWVAQSIVRPVILAAGAGRRFGGDKLLASVDGEPLIRGVVRAYAGLCGTVKVVVAPGSPVVSALADMKVEFVVNRDAEEGIASSIRAGISSCGDQPAVMIALADEPRVNRTLVLDVMRAWHQRQAPIVAPRFNGGIGHPVLFDRTCFSDLLALDGDAGARAVIQGMGARVEYIDVAMPRPVDIDEPNDLQTFQDHSED